MKAVNSQLKSIHVAELNNIQNSQLTPLNQVTRDKILIPSLLERPASISEAERQPAILRTERQPAISRAERQSAILRTERQPALIYGTDAAEEVKVPAPEPASEPVQEGVMSLERQREYLEVIGPCPKLPSEYLRFMQIVEEEDEYKLWSDSDDNLDALNKEESGELEEQEAAEQTMQPANEGQAKKIVEPGETADSMIETYDKVIMFFGKPLVVKQQRLKNGGQAIA